MDSKIEKEITKINVKLFICNLLYEKLFSYRKGDFLVYNVLFVSLAPYKRIILIENRLRAYK